MYTMDSQVGVDAVLYCTVLYCTAPLPGGAGGDVVAPDHGGVSAGEHPAQLSGLAVSVA